MDKTFKIIINGAVKSKLKIKPTNTIRDIKYYFDEKYPDYKLHMFYTNKNGDQLEISILNSYDTLESVWANLISGCFQLTDKEYLYDKYVATNFKDTLDKYGVAIIPNILSDQEIKNMKNGMWDFLERITSQFEIPINRSNQETWKEIYKLFPLHSMLIQHWKIGHAQFLWDLRQNPKILDIFANLWNISPEELLVSFDGFSFHMPPEITNRGYYRNKNWFHTDQSLSNSDFKCVQSWVTAYDVNEGDATLTFLEGSHKYHEEFALKFKKTGEKSDWYKLSTQKEMDFFINKGCKIRSIVCPEGSLVLWDSRTMHAGKESLKERAKANFRGIGYLCYTPRKLATQTLLKKKQKAFNEMRTTSHWPHKPKLFPKTPRTYGAELPEIVDIEKPIVNSLGMKLAGF